MIVSAEKRPRQGELVVLCPKCGARCEANRSEPSFTRYYCENRPECDGMVKVPRPGNGQMPRPRF